MVRCLITTDADNSMHVDLCHCNNACLTIDHIARIANTEQLHARL